MLCCCFLQRWPWGAAGDDGRNWRRGVSTCRHRRQRTGWPVGAGGNSRGLKMFPANPKNSLESNPVTDAESQVPAEAPGLTFPTENNVTDENDGETSSTSDLPPLIGPGAPLSGLPPSAGGGLIQPSSAGGELDGGGSELKPGETAFLGVADSGKSFVYVIDTSSSMGEQNRLQVAKSQLKGLRR